MKELTLLIFSNIYPDEEFSMEALRHFREGHGLSHSRCSCTHLYWDKAHYSWFTDLENCDYAQQGCRA